LKKKHTVRSGGRKGNKYKKARAAKKKKSFWGGSGPSRVGGKEKKMPANIERSRGTSSRIGLISPRGETGYDYWDKSRDPKKPRG